MRLFSNTKFDFIGLRYICFSISVFLAIICILSIVLKGGLNLGIDFTGGLIAQIKFEKPVVMSNLRQTLTDSGLDSFQLQDFPRHNSVIINMKGKSTEQEKVSKDIMNAVSGYSTEFSIERTEYVGPRVGEFLVKKALLAILLSFAGIVIYVAIRFKSTVWGVSGVIALVHDIFITVGVFSLLNKEITLTVIAAILTLAGYSINDTIVVFDRIRENLSLIRREELGKIINASINQTLSRTVVTGVSTLLVVIILFFFGGEFLHDFSFALLFGIIIGTFSSVFIASPIVYEWLTYRSKKKR